MPFFVFEISAETKTKDNPNAKDWLVNIST
jgi:hypothetical protein